MRLNDDDVNEALSTEVIAKRGALLAEVAENAYKELLKTDPDATAPVYIVGSEVPIPGGATAETVETEVQVTKVEDFKATYDTFKKAFAERNLHDAWKNVVAIVVQPGVEEKMRGVQNTIEIKPKI